MKKKINLKTQIYLLIVAKIVILVSGGIVICCYTLQIEQMFSNIINKNLANYQLAETLETALGNQKGFVTYYYLDKNPDWLKLLGEHRQIFKERLKEIKTQTETENQIRTLKEIENNYNLYLELQDKVIGYYAKGEIQAGLDLHNTVRNLFASIKDACEEYKKIHKQKIAAEWERSRKKTQRLIGSVIVTAAIVSGLIFLLLVILITGILEPLHRLSRVASKDRQGVDSRDDIQVLSNNVKGLIREADLAQAKLKQNREIMIQSEKLALVGKLAAGMAHSIRNPLTSVKMRLFSLNRTLNLNASQKEDFDVIAEEIKRLDIIVQNFLEFSRPPKLTMAPLSLTSVVDQSLQLLEHRLRSYNVTVEVERNRHLPNVTGDSEQLKEVLVNLIVNACESMEKGGIIRIREDEYHNDQALFARIRLTDSGPGIPDTIIEKIFQPFFTTKEEGTGLGLSIAARIIQDHQGYLQVESGPGQGATFSLMLPALGEVIEDTFNRR
jgi:signal transduction histidine kinase